MSKTTYKIVDLLILTVISAIIEVINLVAFEHFPFEGFSASFIMVLGIIAMFRWGYIGAVVPVVSGSATVLYVAIRGGELDPRFILSSTIGYGFMVVACLFFRKGCDKREFSKNIGKLFLFFITAFIAAEVGRAVCYIGSINVGSALFTFFVLDLFNLVLNLVVFFIGTKRKNFVYDMNDYLEDINATSKIPSSATIREAQVDYMALESLAESNQVSECALLDGGMLTEDDLIELQKNYNRFEGKTGRFDNKNENLNKEEQHGQSK